MLDIITTPTGEVTSQVTISTVKMAMPIEETTVVTVVVTVVYVVVRYVVFVVLQTVAFIDLFISQFGS